MTSGSKSGSIFMALTIMALCTVMVHQIMRDPQPIALDAAPAAAPPAPAAAPAAAAPAAAAPAAPPAAAAPAAPNAPNAPAAAGPAPAVDAEDKNPMQQAEQVIKIASECNGCSDAEKQYREELAKDLRQLAASLKSADVEANKADKAFDEAHVKFDSDEDAFKELESKAEKAGIEIPEKDKQKLIQLAAVPAPAPAVAASGPPPSPVVAPHVDPASPAGPAAVITAGSIPHVTTEEIKKGMTKEEWQATLDAAKKAIQDEEKSLLTLKLTKVRADSKEASAEAAYETTLQAESTASTTTAGLISAIVLFAATALL